jgi:hypothetical protein
MATNVRENMWFVYGLVGRILATIGALIVAWA